MTSVPKHYEVTVGRVEPPETGDWAQAFATRNIDGDITDWYLAHTGHDDTLAYENIVGGLTITDSWLATNNGNGRVSFADGRWLVERYRMTGSLTINSNNVTMRNMFVDSAGALYLFRSTVNPVGVILEHSTLSGNNSNANTSAINFSQLRNSDQVTLRYNNISGSRAGIYCFYGITAEYNYVHDLYFTPESHNTGASIRGGNVTLRRNLITDGNSSDISFYPEYAPYTNILVTQNALRLQDADTGPEVILAAGRAYSIREPGESVRLVGNLFFRGGNRGEGGGIGGYLEGFTEITGNFDRLGEVVD